MMRCERARRYMMEHLYGEITSTDLTRLLKHLQHCVDCAVEWEEVQYSHKVMTSLSDEPLPAHLEHAVLEASKTTDTVPIHNSSRLLRRWIAVAAVFLILILSAGSTFYVLNQPTQSNEQLAFDSQPDVEKIMLPSEPLSRMPRGEENEAGTVISQLPKSDRGLAPTNGGHKAYTTSNESENNNPEKMFAGVNSYGMKKNGTKERLGIETKAKSVSMLLDTKAVNAEQAEELFRIGLNLYNKAFTKIGSEREVILNSAIIYFRDFEKQHPDFRKWIALGKFLSADSCRELGNIDMAVGIYRQVIEEYTDMDACVKNARLSIIKLLLDENKQLQQVESELEQFEKQYPLSPEFARFALEYADKVHKKSPEKAAVWCRNVMNHWPEYHPTWLKAQELSDKMQDFLLEKETIKDWWITGPVDRDMITQEIFIKDFQSLTPHYFEKKRTFMGVDISWKRPFPGESGEVDLGKCFQQYFPTACAYAVTFVHSARNQVVLLSYAGTDGMRIWIDNNPVVGSIWKDQYQQNMIEISLKEGWNTLTIKSYHVSEKKDWRFSIRFLDRNGYIIPDIHADPEKQLHIHSGVETK